MTKPPPVDWALIAESMHNIGDLFTNICEMGQGLRTRLEAQGWSPTMAEHLAADAVRSTFQMLVLQQRPT